MFKGTVSYAIRSGYLPSHYYFASLRSSFQMQEFLSSKFEEPLLGSSNSSV